MNKFYPRFEKDFLEMLEGMKGEKAAVLGHLRPDGDCIGSQVAFCRCLLALGIEAVCVNPHRIPRTLQPFVGDTPFLPLDEFQGRGQGYLGANVDCADKVRIGQELQVLFPEILVNIDHHISNEGYARYNFIDAGSSATAEILAGLFFDCALPIDETTAQALYMGIVTDTGQFRFPSTTGQVFEICRLLIERGADPAAAAMELFERESLSKLRLLERFLGSLRLECGGRACIGVIKNGVYTETGANREDSEGLVDYARSIEGVEIAVLLEERDGAIKGSFRSKDPAHRVDLLARNFNGGGHACAAGFNCSGRLEDFYTDLLEVLREHFEQSQTSTVS